MTKVRHQAGGMTLSVSGAFKSAGKQSLLGRLLTVWDSYRLSSEAVSEQRFQAADKALRRGMTSNMDSNGAGSVQYNRWNEDNINMNVEGSQSTMNRLYNRMCVGSTGIAVKVAGALAALVSIYIIGYVTGYYVHRC